MEIPLSPASLHEILFFLLNSLQGIPTQHCFVERKNTAVLSDKLPKPWVAFYAEVHAFPTISSFFLTFLVVEVNLAIYMFLESIGSSACIQYQERYIFLSSSSFHPSKILTQRQRQRQEITKTKYWPLCLHSISAMVLFWFECKQRQRQSIG